MSTDAHQPAVSGNNVDGETTRWVRRYLVVVLLLAGFAALVTAMIWLAGGDDTVWQRRIYVFSAVQAIVFTAIGWLFGREVGRSATEAARTDAQTARQQADEARSEARQHATAAAELQAKAEAIQAAAGSTPESRQAAATDVGARDDRRPGIDLRTFINELLGP